MSAARQRIREAKATLDAAKRVHEDLVFTAPPMHPTGDTFRAWVDRDGDLVIERGKYSVMLQADQVAAFWEFLRETFLDEVGW